MKKNKSNFDFKLSTIKKKFDVKDFIKNIGVYNDQDLLDAIFESTIFNDEANRLYGSEANPDQIDELIETMYSDFYESKENVNIRKEIFEHLFNGTLLSKISDNFKTEFYFQYKNESHYLVYSNFKKLRIYIACIKNSKDQIVNSYIVHFSYEKFSKLRFLGEFIYENHIKNEEEKLLFENPENYYSEETGLDYTDYYLFFVKSNLPKINFSKKTKKEVLQIIEHDNSTLRDLPNNLGKNKDFILEVIKLCQHHILPLYYIDDIFKKDKEVVFEAIKQDERAFQFAHKDLKKDKDFILEVLNYRGDVLRYIDDSLKKDKEVALLAFEDLVGYQLKYLDKNLKNDFEVVYAAVRTHGSALEFASDQLKRNEDIVLKAISSDPKAIKYADAKLKGNKKFIQKAINEDLRVKDFL